jgi:hypothetical protein
MEKQEYLKFYVEKGFALVPVRGKAKVLYLNAGNSEPPMTSML